MAEHGTGGRSMTRVVEVNTAGQPVAVFHRYGREAWSHPYTQACALCRKAGQTVQRRKELRPVITALYVGEER